MEEKMTGTTGACDPVGDRVEELCDDMEGGFGDLRSQMQEMDADGLRREMSLLMMIGNSQMTTIQRLRRDVDEMDRKLQFLRSERNQIKGCVRELADVMGIPFDPDDFSPAKLVRTAATVAGRYAERRMQPFELEVPEPEATADRREGGVEVAMVVALSVFVLCVVVWTAMMVSAWL